MSTQIWFASWTIAYLILLFYVFSEFFPAIYACPVLSSQKEEKYQSMGPNVIAVYRCQNVTSLPEITSQMYKIMKAEANQFVGVLSPINQSGTSIFKVGSMIPVKFYLRDVNGNFITNASVTFISQHQPNGLIIGSTPFEFDSATGQYVYNWNTTGSRAGQWVLKLFVDYGKPSEDLLVGRSEQDITVRLTLVN